MRPLWIFLLLLSLTVMACTEKYGQAIDRAYPKTKIAKALTDQSLKDKDINVEGTILTQCYSGCWFFLKDETGQILVDLAPNHFTIPVKTGKKVAVTGTVVEDNGSVKIIGKAVEIS